MKFLITGGAGFIGSHLCRTLLEQEHQVLILDNFDPYYDVAIKHRNILPFKNHPNFTLVEGDIRDKTLIDKTFGEFKPDVVYHLAAKAGVRPSIQYPQEYMEVNIMGTTNILEAMKDNGIKKLIFASSSSVYGNNKKVPFEETDNVDFPISPYAASKKAGELLCYNYHSLYGMDIYCMRFFTVYGPAQRPEMAISLFTNNIINDQSITMFGEGDTRRDYTFIDDIIQGLTKAQKHFNGFGIFNLGNSDTISLKGLISTIERTVGKKAIIEQKPMQSGDVNITFADITKAKQVFDYQPTTKIEAGIEKYYQWLQKDK